MISKQLLNYIEKEDKLGKNKKEIEKILLSADWHKDAISDAFDIYYKKDDSKSKESVESSKPLELESPHDMLLEDGDTDEAKKVEVSVTHKNNEPASEAKKPAETEEKFESKPEVVKEDKNSNRKPLTKERRRRVRPVFLIMLSFVLGIAVMLAVSIFFLNSQTKNTETAPQKATGFEAQKIDDGKRVAEVLEIQKSLESYYNEYKSYPENINLLKNAPTVSSELNYTYTPIGSPPQSYTLNIEMKNTEDGEFKIDGGFMTLKNKQGAR